MLNLAAALLERNFPSSLLQRLFPQQVGRCSDEAAARRAAPRDRGEQGHPDVPPGQQLGGSSVGLSPPGSEPELTNSPGMPAVPCTRCLHPGLRRSLNADAESEPGAVPGQQGTSSWSD